MSYDMALRIVKLLGLLPHGTSFLENWCTDFFKLSRVLPPSNSYPSQLGGNMRPSEIPTVHSHPAEIVCLFFEQKRQGKGS